jgi:hypothetical protein
MPAQSRSYGVGFLICALVGSIAISLTADDVTGSLAVDILARTTSAIIFNLIAGGIVFGISGVFVKRFTFERFIKISAIVCFVWMLFSTIASVKASLFEI